MARPDRHLLVEDGRARLTHGPKEDRHRPAVDALFRTATVVHGPQVVGVKRRGGIAVVQDPDETLFSGMPHSALQFVDVDHCLPLKGMASLLSRLSREPAGEEGDFPVPDDMNLEAKVTSLDPGIVRDDERPGQLSHFTCPECTGPLYQLQDGQLVRFRCRVGHAYTAESMPDEKDEGLESVLYAALNTLEESASMSNGLAVRSREGATSTRRRASPNGPARPVNWPGPYAAF